MIEQKSPTNHAFNQIPNPFRILFTFLPKSLAEEIPKSSGNACKHDNRIEEQKNASKRALTIIPDDLTRVGENASDEGDHQDQGCYCDHSGREDGE